MINRTLLSPAIVAIGASLVLSACAPSVVERQSVSAPFDLAGADQTAPRGGAVSDDIVNYSRAAPFVGIGGALKGDGVAEAQRLGFQLIVDLRQPDETGVEANAGAAKALGVNRLHMPFASDETVWQQVDILEDALADPSNYPVLIHCGSANRAAAAWTLYRARQGVDPITAIEEGRTLGLTSRETFVRDMLGISG